MFLRRLNIPLNSRQKHCDFHPTPDEFGGGRGLVGEIAKKIRRRLVVRPSPDVMLDEQSAQRIIHDVMPESVGLDSMYFDRYM